MNWFRCPDGSSGQLMWIPPSIKAAGKYIFTDLTYLPWNAPAGMRRGVVGDAVDVSFNPDRTESDTIYIHGWNYAVSYPLDGIVIEGQKTFQADKTALDRVNVRRLMLTIEKTTRDYARRFNYEQNTPVLRQRFTDTINNFLEQVKIGDGISEYLVVCDERNNTDETIDNNELHVTVAVKPIKAIEYIVLNFVCTNQSANVEEMAISNM